MDHWQNTPLNKPVLQQAHAARNLYRFVRSTRWGTYEITHQRLKKLGTWHWDTVDSNYEASNTEKDSAECVGNVKDKSRVSDCSVEGEGVDGGKNYQPDSEKDSCPVAAFSQKDRIAEDSRYQKEWIKMAQIEAKIIEQKEKTLIETDFLAALE